MSQGTWCHSTLHNCRLIFALNDSSIDFPLFFGNVVYLITITQLKAV